MRCPLLSTFALALAAGWAVPARALCTSDAVPQPEALLERFISADCPDCWGDAATPEPRGGVAALDWIVPGAGGEDAPLSAAASPDARQRLRSLRRAAPASTDSATSLREGPPLALRLAQGEPVNDHIGVIIELQADRTAGWDSWLLLVESLPAGSEGSPVARNLVRNVARPDWRRARTEADGRLSRLHTLLIPDSARPERLRFWALLRDAAGRMRAIVRTECPP